MICVAPTRHHGGLRSCPIQFAAPDQQVLSSFMTSVRSALVRSAPHRFVLISFALVSFAPANIASLRSAPVRFASLSDSRRQRRTSGTGENRNCIDLRVVGAAGRAAPDLRDRRESQRLATVAPGASSRAAPDLRDRRESQPVDTEHGQPGRTAAPDLRDRRESQQQRGSWATGSPQQRRTFGTARIATARHAQCRCMMWWQRRTFGTGENRNFPAAPTTPAPSGGSAGPSGPARIATGSR